jgi:hypothetical protein
MRITVLYGELKLQFTDTPRALSKQQLALTQGLEDQPKLKVFKVPKTTVDQTRRAGAGAVAKITSFDQMSVEAAQSRLSGYRSTVDSSTDDDDVCISM